MMTRRAANQQSRISTKNMHGFTLLELLVVVAVIAVLVSILVPSLKQARQQAVMVACGANQRGAYTAILTYAQDYGEYPTLSTWEEEADTRGEEAQGTATAAYENLLIAGRYALRHALQCTERQLGPGCERFDHFRTEPWYRYNGPSAVGYWIWHYGHGGQFRKYGWHWFNWTNAPWSSSRGPSYGKPLAHPDPQVPDPHGSRALGCCPRSLVCPPSWAYGWAHEPHMDRRRSADVPSQCQFSDHGNTALARNYYFVDGHVEAIIRE